MLQIPELLAPAGDLERLRYAINYGADAVYCGLPEFGMRSAPANFTPEQLAEGVINSEIYMEHFAISTVDPKESDAPTVVAAKVANDLLNIEGIRASFVTTEKDGTVYMSARSVDDVNVQIIMEELGGGGHQTVAGVQLKNISVEEVKKQIIALAKKQLEENEKEQAQ